MLLKIPKMVESSFPHPWYACVSREELVRPFMSWWHFWRVTEKVIMLNDWSNVLKVTQVNQISPIAKTGSIKWSTYSRFWNLTVLLSMLLFQRRIKCQKSLLSVPHWCTRPGKINVQNVLVMLIDRSNWFHVLILKTVLTFELCAQGSRMLLPEAEWQLSRGAVLWVSFNDSLMN